MKLFITKLFFLSLLFLIMLQLAGCGETISGIGKDAKRVGQGVKTIFFRESN